MDVTRLLQSCEAATNACFDASDCKHEGSLKQTLLVEWNRAFQKGSGNDNDNSGSATVRSPDNSFSAQGSAGNQVTDRWFERLYRQHTESMNDDKRVYHTAVHLHEMLQYWNVLSTIPDVQNWQQQEDGSQDCIIRLAIFFHDAVYNPKSGTNEIDSARLFLDFVSELKSDAATATTATTKALKITVSPWVASQVVTYILATQKHTLLALPSLMGDTATESDDAMVTTQSPVFGQAVFLDIDMAVLGKEPTTAYPSYAKCIRDEYDHFPFIPDYCKGRSSVLETFLKSSIFCTKYFHDAFDGLARDNLRKEIDQLQEQLRLQSGNDS